MNLRSLLIGSLFLFLKDAALAQYPQYKWARSAGSTDYDIGLAVATDADRNIYTVGYYSATADFNPGSGVNNLVSAGNRDGFIQKLDQNGSFLWAKSIGGTLADYCDGVAVDPWGNVYITGNFNGTADFDPGTAVYNLTSAGADDIYILKLDPLGNFLWAKSIGGTQVDGGDAIIVDAKGNVFSTGLFQNTVDFNPGAGTYNLSTSSYSAVGTYILKLDSAGNFNWVKAFLGNGEIIGNAITLNKQGQIFSTGRFTGTADFDPGTAAYGILSAGYEDIYVSKLDSSGNFIWAKAMGGNNHDIGYGIVIDSSNNVYTTGTFNGTADFNPHFQYYYLTSAGYEDVFVSKLDSNGDFVWADRMGGLYSDYAYAMAIDALGGIYIAGRFFTTGDFDPGTGTYNLTSAGGADVFMEKLDASGNMLWAKQFGGTQEDAAFGLAIASATILYITGAYTSTVDFDPGTPVVNLTSNGALDVFTCKFFLCSSNITFLNVNACNSYTFYGNTYTQSGVHNIYLTNINGCDSILNLTVTINAPSPDSTLFYTACDSIKINNKSYYSSGLYQQIFTNMKGCDSVVKLNITIKSTTFSYISQTKCDSIRINGTGYFSSGNYKQYLLNAKGCDSILTLNLTIPHSTFSTIVQTACDSFYLNGIPYYNTGTYFQTRPNKAGCDSIITLKLTLRRSSAASMIRSACDSFILNSQTYKSTGNYIQKFVNASGCDSILTLSLTINHPSQSVITTTECVSYSLNGQTYSSSGVFKQTLVNSNGCDSILTLNLAINTVDIGVTKTGNTLSANANNATYQWVTCPSWTQISGATNQMLVAPFNSDFAVIVKQHGCIDTSNCVNITGVGIPDLKASAHYILFPNPADEGLNIISYLSERQFTFEISNNLGVLIRRSNALGNKHFVDISEFSAGVYFLKITDSAKESVIYKFIKK